MIYFRYSKGEENKMKETKIICGMTFEEFYNDLWLVDKDGYCDEYCDERCPFFPDEENDE